MENLFIGVLSITSILGGFFTDTFEYTKEISAETALASYTPLIAPELPIVSTSTPETINTLCSCVAFVRSKIPTLPRGDAKDLETNSLFPVKGSAVKLSYRQGNEKTPMLYHVAYVHEISTDGKILISSDCKHGKHEIIYEWIDVNSDRIQGYWSPKI